MEAKGEEEGGGVFKFDKFCQNSFLMQFAIYADWAHARIYCIRIRTRGEIYGKI